MHCLVIGGGDYGTGNHQYRVTELPVWEPRCAFCFWLLFSFPVFLPSSYSVSLGHPTGGNNTSPCGRTCHIGDTECGSDSCCCPSSDFHCIFAWFSSSFFFFFCSRGLNREQNRESATSPNCNYFGWWILRRVWQTNPGVCTWFDVTPVPFIPDTNKRDNYWKILFGVTTIEDHCFWLIY